MKRMITICVLAFFVMGKLCAMSFEMARREALFLTDKMAYELNLNEIQYDYAYEINLDYLLNLHSPSDLHGVGYRVRCTNICDILHDWQYRLFIATDYFLRPVVWANTAWHFPIYSHYVHTHYYYSRPRVYHSYQGRPSHRVSSHRYYEGRRPQWSHGMRGGVQSVGRRDAKNAPHDMVAVRGQGYSFSLSPQNNVRRTNNVSSQRRRIDQAPQRNTQKQVEKERVSFQRSSTHVTAEKKTNSRTRVQTPANNSRSSRQGVTQPTRSSRQNSPSACVESGRRGR